MSGLLPSNPNSSPNPNPNPVVLVTEAAPPKRPVEATEQPPKRIRISVTPGTVNFTYVENRGVASPAQSLTPQQSLDRAQFLNTRSFQSTVFEDYCRLRLEALGLIWAVFTQGNSIGSQESFQAFLILRSEFNNNYNYSQFHAQLKRDIRYLFYGIGLGKMLLDKNITFTPQNVQYTYGLEFCLKLSLHLKEVGADRHISSNGQMYADNFILMLLSHAYRVKTSYMTSDAYKRGIKPFSQFIDNEMDLAFRIFKSFAEFNELARRELGLCYFEGLGVAQDYQAAFRLLDSVNYPTYELGVCYYEGKGTPQDREKAIDMWLEFQSIEKIQIALTNHYLSLFSEDLSLLFKGILEPYRSVYRLCFLRTFFYLPVDIQEKVIGFFQDMQSQEDLRALFQAWHDKMGPNGEVFMLNGDEDMRGYPEMFIFFLQKADLDLDAIKARWVEILRDSDVRIVRQLVRFLTRFFEISDMFSEFDEFTQEYVAADIRLEQMDERTSPYKIFQDIKANRAIACEVTQVPSETYQGVKMSLKPAFLKNELVGRQVYVRDLPKLDLHARLQSAVEALIQRKNETGFDDAVKIATGSSLDELESQALGSSYLLNLLTYENKKPGELVPLIALKFMKIVENIFSKSPEREEGQVLSNREETLLKTLASIGGCVYGKREGIDAFYPSVAAEFPIRSTGAVGDIAQMKPGEEMVYEGITNAIEIFVADPQSYFYKVLCGESSGDKVMEGAHQTIYVKNMIGGEIGLEDRIIFDIHTPFIYEPLLAKSKQEILDMFYQHFRPLSLIGYVRTYLNKVLALPKSTAYTHLSEAFQDVLDGCTDPWQIDTDKVSVELTDEAVMKMLLKTGVLSAVV